MRTPVNNQAVIDKQIERVAYGMQEAATAIGLRDTVFRELCESGAIPTFRIGRRRLVRKRDLHAYVDRLYSEQCGGELA